MFSRLFKEFFKLKTKNVYWILVIQLIASVAITIFTRYGYSEGRYFSYGKLGFLPELLSIFFTTVFFFDFAFYILTLIDNERANGNQTLRLLPISDTGYYLSNLLSSFVAIVYFGILELLATIILLAITELSNTNFRNETITLLRAMKTWNYNISNNMIFAFIGVILIMILSLILVYLLINFLGFSSSSIMNFLPGASSRAALRSIRLIIIILLAWLLIRASNILLPILASPFEFFLSTWNRSYSDLTMSVLFMIFIDGLFMIINLYLFNKYYEISQKN